MMSSPPLANITTVELSTVEHQVLLDAAKDCTHNDPVLDTDGYVREAQLLADHLPQSLRSVFLDLRAKGSTSGGVLIRNVPLGSVPATPAHADFGTGIRLLAAKVLSVLVAPLGEQFGFLPELGGQIVQDILPVAGFEATQQSISSSALLEMHCETAFTDVRPDFVGLLCLRSDRDHSAATMLSSAGDVVRRLAPATRELLRQPRFATAVDTSFRRGSGISEPRYVHPIRVLSGTETCPRLRCDVALTIGFDQESRRALKELHAAVGDAARSVYLEPGDLLIIDNHGAMHGRTGFSRSGDGHDRWLLRTFVARDLTRSVAYRPSNGRIVEMDYSALTSACAEVGERPLTSFYRSTNHDSSRDEC